DPVPYWPVGQKIIQSLGNVTAEGFLYRVDMRLRPWGESGPLVNSIDAHLEYLRMHGQPWERQALIKARVVAGDRKAGARFLKQVDRLIYAPPPPDLRAGILESKRRIERGLTRRGEEWGEVKSGKGSLRDVEFITQYLQLLHGSDRPELRTFNTLDGLVRLVEFGFLRPDEYRQLSTGYLYLRKVEHVLQLMHNVQSHKLPEDEAALESLAYRLDFESAEQFVRQYEMHRQSIRTIFQHHLEAEAFVEPSPKHHAADRLLEQIVIDEPGYDHVFSEREREHHRQLLGSLGPDRLAAVSASVQGNTRRWKVAVAGHDEPGALLAMCGLLFAAGLDILEGRVYTGADVSSTGSNSRADRAALFLNYFTLEASADSEIIDQQFWNTYEMR
ncbi:MAG TPA: glutamine synthetase adenylyltransferase, partial [Planctomycetaceae bacterium]|nr:glutamine synthetase adenylyltransferase [Planctomycetaceae bacterium]